MMKIIVGVFVAAMIAPAQWLDYPTPGVPRLLDGKPNLTAPAPKTADGKPDLSGIWTTKAGYTGNIARDLKPGELSFQPWASEVYKHRQETQGMIAILYEALHSYRQIFMDGRKLPKDPNPTWMGYSVGHWDADTLVVDSSGFVDNNWLDNSGHPGTESLRLTERFRRRDFGHIDTEI